MIKYIIRNKINESNNILNEACVIAVSEIERLARIRLNNNKKLGEFIMAMGSYFFTLKNGEVVHDFKDKKIDSIINEFDDFLKITGTPMRFTANGKKIEDW